jgi:hypothetical protein
VDGLERTDAAAPAPLAGPAASVETDAGFARTPQIGAFRKVDAPLMRRTRGGLESDGETAMKRLAAGTRTGRNRLPFQPLDPGRNAVCVVGTKPGV